MRANEGARPLSKPPATFVQLDAFVQPLVEPVAVQPIDEPVAVVQAGLDEVVAEDEAERDAEE